MWSRYKVTHRHLILPQLAQNPSPFLACFNGVPDIYYFNHLTLWAITIQNVQFWYKYYKIFDLFKYNSTWDCCDVDLQHVWQTSHQLHLTILCHCTTVQWHNISLPDWQVNFYYASEYTVQAAVCIYWLNIHIRTLRMTTYSVEIWCWC